MMRTDFAMISRRRVLQTGMAATGGLLIEFCLPLGRRFADATVEAGDEPNVAAWLHIAPDDTVTIQVAHSEMGQGVYTSLPMLIAEELEADWSKVRVETAPAAPVYRNRLYKRQVTGASTSIRESYDHLRQVGAVAREMLKAAAAAAWNVAPGELRARNGFVLHEATGRRSSYGELAEAAASMPPAAEVSLKDSKDWTIIGKPTRRLDTPAKVDGSALFGIDVRVDGMLVGTPVSAPLLGGKLKELDPKPAMAVDGVRCVVQLEDTVIVVADGYWPAKKGSERLDPVWEPGSNAGMNSETLRAEIQAGLEEPGARARDVGDVESVMARADHRIEAVYDVPFLAHATMEPMNATAHVTSKGVEIWAPTQNQERTQLVIAKMAGVEPEQVKVHTTFLGGGFGRRLEVDFIVQAVLASKAAGAPVKVVWSREEDLRRDFYRPMAFARFRAPLDGSGMLRAWHIKIACPSIWSRYLPQMIKDGVDNAAVEGLVDTPYEVPNQRVDYVMKNTAVPVGFWRSVGHSHNAFFMESFIDEVAHAGGHDPVEFRLSMLTSKPRHRAVVERAAAAAGWGKRSDSGRFLGFALHESFGSIVAEVVEISVEKRNALRLHKVTCEVDCGRSINPDTVKAQLEGAVAFGLTAALFGEITVRDGKIEQGNFDTYRMLLLSQMPQVEVHLIESGEKLGGIGEVGMPPIAPALTNALFAATAMRVRSLPLSRHGISVVHR